ncbi:MAG: radical SAM protein [Nanoarchaeota archaeon]
MSITTLAEEYATDFYKETDETLKEFIKRGEFPFNYEEQLLYQHKDFLKDILTEKTVPPLHFEFLPTEKCNNNCKWCHGGHRDFMANENELEENVMLKLIEELADYEIKGIVRFSGMSGEPLMNSGTLKTIQKGAKLGLNIGLITNGILLTKESHDYLKETKYASISLDAGNSNTFNYLKGHNDNTFEKIVNNISNLVSFKQENNEDFRISVGYILHPRNLYEIIQATKRIKNTGADILQFKVPYATGEDSFTQKQIREILCSIQEAKKYSDKEFQVIAMQTKDEREKELSGELPKPTFSRCYAQALNGIIGADGNVYPCVHYYYNKDSIAGQPIGNMHEQTFKEIWEGEKRADIIQRINPQKDCQFCNRYDNRINNLINFLMR